MHENRETSGTSRSNQDRDRPEKANSRTADRHVAEESDRAILVAKLQAIKTELKRRRHEPVASVGAWLQKVSSGYYQYHAVPGNLDRLQLFRWRLRWLWYRVLSRRSQRSRLSMDRLNRIIDRWIPVPRVLHPYPMQRFDASHPRREPYA